MLAKTPRGADGKYRALASLLIAGKPMGPFQYQRNARRRSQRPGGARTSPRPARAAHPLRLARPRRFQVAEHARRAHRRGRHAVHQALPDRFRRLARQRQLHGQQPARRQRVPVRLEVLRRPVLHARDCMRRSGSTRSIRSCRRPAASSTRCSIPTRWVGDYPNTAFRNENPADRLWAARKIAAFTDEEIRAIVSTGQYTDPAAEEWVARCLIERRKKIVNAFLDRDGRAGSLRSARRPAGMGLRGTGRRRRRCKVQWSIFDNQTGRRRILPGATSRELPEAGGAGGVPGGRAERRRADRRFRSTSG